MWNVKRQQKGRGRMKSFRLRMRTNTSKNTRIHFCFTITILVILLLAANLVLVTNLSFDVPFKSGPQPQHTKQSPIESNFHPKRMHIQHQYINGTSSSTLSPMLNQTSQNPFPSCLVFQHIPKSGGRSFVGFLKDMIRVLGYEKYYAIYEERKNEIYINDPNFIATNGTFVFGHFSTRLFVLNPSLARDCFIMTILREPVDRAISAYFFHSHLEKEIPTCLNDNVTERLTCYLHWQYSNDITRTLSISKKLDWVRYKWGLIPLRFPDKFKKTKTKVKKAKRYGVIPVTQSELDNAKTNLQKYYDLVCFLDDLESCTDRLLKAFQIDPMNTSLDLSAMTIRRDNRFKYKGKHRPNKLDKKYLAQFEKQNQLDIDFYNYAKSNIL